MESRRGGKKHQGVKKEWLTEAPRSLLSKLSKKKKTKNRPNKHQQKGESASTQKQKQQMKSSHEKAATKALSQKHVAQIKRLSIEMKQPMTRIHCIDNQYT